MILARLEEGNIRLCPQKGRDGEGRYHTDLRKYYAERTDRDGWMELVETEAPEGNYRPVYTEQDGKIVQSWEPAEEPAQEPDPYQMRADIDYIAMMGDYDIGDAV